LTFIDAIKMLGKLEDLSEYTYYGFGGPYLEDCRLVYESCPAIKMVSIEEDEETYKRQVFHLPCGTLELRRTQFTSFLAQYEANDEKSIFWLDFTGLEYRHFEDLMIVLGKVSANSMIKITLRAHPRDYTKSPGELRKRFDTLMPNPSSNPPSDSAEFANVVQEMTQVACQRALPAVLPLMFQPVSSFYYSDGTGMFTLTGVVCQRDEEAKVRRVFKSLQCSNLDWSRPRHIDVPVLSTKERLHLQHRLPHGNGAGQILRLSLGYLIDEDRKSTELKLQQYADFHRYFPYFMRATP
jgi:hypothetical protein